MEHNPYSPPAALVSDAEQPPGKRPVAVSIAVALIVAYVLLTVFGYLGAWRLYLGAGGSMFYLHAIQLLKWGLLAFTAYQLWRGRNRGRILMLIFAALGLLSMLTTYWSMRLMPAGVRLQMDFAAVAMIVLPSAVYLSVVVLVYFPGRRWFRRG